MILGKGDRTTRPSWKWFVGELKPHQRALVTAILAANLVLVAIYFAGFFVSTFGYDWDIFVEAGRRVWAGDLYAWEGPDGWRYSPLLAYAFTALEPVGFWGWAAVHVAALPLLRDRWLMIITLASFPFWADVYNGNTMTFVFVAAVAAMMGSPIGAGAYLQLFLLMPRPLMLPLVAWILWRQAGWRLGFVVMMAVNAALVLATGYGPEWLETLVGVSDAVAATSRDIGPGNLIGPWWTVFGIGLAVVLTLRGRIGWASLAAAPYWLPQYLLMLILELVPRSPRTQPGHRGDAEASGVASVERGNLLSQDRH